MLRAEANISLPRFHGPCLTSEIVGAACHWDWDVTQAARKLGSFSPDIDIYLWTNYLSSRCNWMRIIYFPGEVHYLNDFSLLSQDCLFGWFFFFFSIKLFLTLSFTQRRSGYTWYQPLGRSLCHWCGSLDRDQRRFYQGSCA